MRTRPAALVAIVLAVLAFPALAGPPTGIPNGAPNGLPNGLPNGSPNGLPSAGAPKGAPTDMVFAADAKEATAARDAIRQRLAQGANCPRRPGDDALISRGQRALDRLRADRNRANGNTGIDRAYLESLVQDLSTWLDRLRRLVCAPAPRPPMRRSGYFLVDIKGRRSGFTEVEGLPTEVDALDYREGVDPPHTRMFPGLRRHLTLKRPWTGDASLYFWFQTAQGGRNDRRDVTVTDTLSGMRRYNFHECWPMRWSGPSLNAKSSGHAVESIELSCERMDFR